MKRIITIFLLFLTIPVFAQGIRDVRAFEGSFSLGVVIPSSRSGFNIRPSESRTYQIEFRYNLRKQPISLGLSFNHSVLAYESEINYSEEGSLSDSYITKPYNSNLMVVGDCNFLRNTCFSPIVGLGIGAGCVGWWDSIFSRGSVCLMPRVGVELWRRLRLMVSYNMWESDNYTSFSVGISFGGGKKR